VYLTGIDKQTGEGDLIELFSSGGRPPIEIDASEISFSKVGGRAWALYGSAEDAGRAVVALHGKNVRGCILCARLERGVEKNGTRITDKTTHTAIVRGIQRRRGTPKKKQTNDGNNSNGNESNNNNNKLKKKKKKGRPNNKANNVDDYSKEKVHRANTDSVVTYSHNSILIGEMEYPFPSGIYSTKLIQGMAAWIASKDEDNQKEYHHQQRRRGQDAKLLRLLSDVSILGCGSAQRYAKEVSEVFAMVDALERGIKLAFGLASVDLQKPVVCYCLGDGKYPIGAAALELFLPKHNENNWKFIAIDPLLPKHDNESVDLGDDSILASSRTTDVAAIRNETSTFHDRIELFSGFSQDYLIENTPNNARCSNSNDNANEGDDASDDRSTTKTPVLLSIAIACHSHAPLEEFWERMPSPKLCVAMPCCAQFSELPKEIPISEYDNYEIYSPKRRIKIFAST